MVENNGYKKFKKQRKKAIKQNKRSMKKERKAENPDQPYAVFKGNTKQTYSVHYGKNARKKAEKDAAVLKRMKIKARIGKYNPPHIG